MPEACVWWTVSGRNIKNTVMADVHQSPSVCPAVHPYQTAPLHPCSLPSPPSGTRPVSPPEGPKKIFCVHSPPATHIQLHCTLWSEFPGSPMHYRYAKPFEPPTVHHTFHPFESPTRPMPMSFGRLDPLAAWVSSLSHSMNLGRESTTLYAHCRSPSPSGSCLDSHIACNEGSSRDL